MIVGIDNGLDGGIVALSPIAGLPPVAQFIMPTMKITQPPRKKTKARIIRELDAGELLRVLDSLGNREGMTIFFEECPYRAERASTMRSMAMSAGKILSIAETRGIAVVRVLALDWQPVILGKVPRGQTKGYALAKAKLLWPDEQWLPSPRHSTPHDGLIDAALIAEYGRRILGGKPLSNETKQS